MTRHSEIMRCGLIGAIALLASGAVAHDSPDQVVAALTRAIERRGRSPELLYRRACERRVLGELEGAESDLAAAVAADPTHFHAGLELARVQLALGRAPAARQSIGAAEPFADTDAERAACCMVRCEAARATGDPAAAIECCNEACRLVPPEADWILLRSRLQGELGRHAERVQSLQAAAERNPSAAITVELLEARIDAGEFRETLEEVESRLALSRWRAAWLIRRARLLIELGRSREARDDLEAAISEIDQRLNPSRPDAQLYLDRGLARALLGDREAACADLQFARQRGADEWQARRLEAALDACK